MIKQYWTRQKTWLLVIITLIGVLALAFTAHNERFYQQPIAKVIAVQTTNSRPTKDQFENVDHQYNQQLRVKMMNGPYYNQKLTVQNTYSDSQPMDQRYRVGDEVFLTQVHRQDGRLSANINGFKRDMVLVFLAWLVVLLLLLLMGRAGFLALLSVVINAALFLFAIEIDLRQNGQHIMLLFSLLAIIFTFISLLLVLGFSKRMLATFVATVMGTFLALGVSLLVFAWTHERGVYYEAMEYVTQIPRSLFLAETLLGSLGAVMDESSDIIATLFELKQLDPAVSRRQLFMAGRQVGKSIMGPLVNVLFLIFMVETFTGSLLYLKNGNSWGYTYAMNMSLGMVQSLISGIGIVLSIPLVSLFGALLLGKGSQK